MKLFAKIAALSLGLGNVTITATAEEKSKFKAREEELKDLNSNLAKKKFFILTGPKQVGKSSLVREITRRDSDSNILYFDLRSKKDVAEVESELKLKIFEYQKKVNKLEVTQEVITDSESVEASLSTKNKGKGFSIHSQKSNQVVTRFELKDQLLQDPNDIPDPVEALRSVLLKKLNKNWYWNPKIPSCIIIDEAQTLSLLGETKFHDLIDSFVTFGRDENLTVVLITSDYSAIEAFVGKE